jgi:hypothetical protein
MEKVRNIKQLLVVGENDPPEFKRQTSAYAQVLQNSDVLYLRLKR